MGERNDEDSSLYSQRAVVGILGGGEIMGFVFYNKVIF
jgi:hypothetical protein